MDVFDLEPTVYRRFLTYHLMKQIVFIISINILGQTLDEYTENGLF